MGDGLDRLIRSGYDQLIHSQSCTWWKFFGSFIVWVWAVAISAVQWFLSSWYTNDPGTVKNKFTFRSEFAAYAALQLLRVWALMSNVFCWLTKWQTGGRQVDRQANQQADRQTDRQSHLLCMQAQCVKGLNPVYKEREPQEPLQEVLWGCTCSCCYSQWLLSSCLPIYGLITLRS